MSWYFFGWRDAVEILFFSSIIYYVSLWLRADTQKNLLFSFYAYCMLFFCAYYAQLTTVTTILIVTVPVTAMIFILLHQQTLQRSFVMLRAIKPAQQETGQWLQVLIRSYLVALNQGKELLCVIEHNDSIRNYIEPSIELNTQLHEGLLDLIVESPTYDIKKLIWCSTRGQLVGINAEWQIVLEELLLHETVQKLSLWQQYAVALTNSSDALVLKSNSTTHTFTVIINGTMYTAVDPNNTLKLIQHYIRHKTIKEYQGVYYGSHTKKSQATSV